MAQIKQTRRLGLSISSIAGSVMLAIAICVVLSSLTAFDQSKALAYNPFQETLLRDKSENSADRLLWLSGQTGIHFTITAVLTDRSRVPVTNAGNRYRAYIAHPPPVKAKFLNITSSSIANAAGITFTTADVCICLLIDLPPPYPIA